MIIQGATGPKDMMEVTAPDLAEGVEVTLDFTEGVEVTLDFMEGVEAAPLIGEMTVGGPHLAAAAGATITAFLRTPPDVTTTENSTIDSNKNIKARIPKTCLVPRPSYGEKGVDLKLVANCFQLARDPDVELRLYDVNVERTASDGNPIAAPAQPPQSLAAIATPALENLSLGEGVAADETTDEEAIVVDTTSDKATTKPPEDSDCESIDSDGTESDDSEPDDDYDNQNIPTGAKLGHIIKHWLDNTPSVRSKVTAGTLASDFRNIVISTVKLHRPELTYTIDYRGEKSRYHVDTYLIKLKEKHKTSVRKLTQYLASTDHVSLSNSRAKRAKNVNRAIQALNIILRQRSKSLAFDVPRTQWPDQAVVGSKAYNLIPGQAQDTRIQLSGGLEAIAGYFSSVRTSAARLLVNVNLTHGPFYHRGELMVVLQQLQDAGFSVEEAHAFLQGRIAGFAVKREDGKLKESEDAVAPAHPPLFKDNAPEYGATCGQIKFWDEGKYDYALVFDSFRTKYHDETYVGVSDKVVNLESRLRPVYYPV
ncbi:hypothetical protein V8F33_010436 [Rhypophila sp. PSN 637]